MNSAETKIQRIKDLYIMTRKKWIVQNPDGSYAHKHYNLHDDRLKEHLEKKITLGVFSGEVYTKWLCWDVDFENNEEKAQQVVRDLVLLLESDYHIARENILVSFSGSKGYHVEIFFNDKIYVNQAKKFHHHVVAQLGESTNKVEFRPQWGIGIKLPLSINKKTGKKCHFVDDHFKRINDNALLEVEQLDAERFLDNIADILEEKEIVLDEQKATEFVEIMEKTTLDLPVDYEERCMTMLSENTLIYTDSRHSSTLLLLTFLSQQGYTEEDAVGIVQKVISNTFQTARHMIDADTTEEKALSEVQRLWKYASTYTLGESKKAIKIYENEILEVLEPKQMHLKHLLFILLVHSKKHAKADEVFYMTYKQMADMGADQNRGRLLKHLLQLEELGYIEVVERDRRQKNGQHHLPNRYKVNIAQTTENYIELNTQTTHEVKLESVVTRLIPENTLKGIVAKKQFYEKFKPMYKAV